MNGSGSQSLAALKWAFLEAVACDPTLSGLDQRVNVLMLSRFLNNKSGDAWPSPETLAAALNASPSGVKKSLRRLSQRWWKQTAKGGGKGSTSRYSPSWETVPARERYGTVIGPRAGTVSLTKQCPDGTSNSARTGPQTVPARVQEPLEEPLDGTGRAREDDWEAWVDFLYDQGRYHEQWGYGSRDLAQDDMDQLRSAKGDETILAALEQARAAGKPYGSNLLDFLKQTYPSSGARRGVCRG